MRNRLIRALIILFVVVLTAEMVAQIYIRSVYHRYEPKGIFWYLDGVVIDHMKLADGVYLNKVYVEGNPLRLLFLIPKYIVISDMIAVVQKMPSKLKLPLPKTDFIFEKITLTVPYQEQNYILYGDLKKFDNEHYQLNFESGEQGIQVALTVDVTFRKRQVIGIEMNADEFSANRPEMKIKRGNAWLSFHLENGAWQPAGEIEAGLMTYAGQVFLDANLTINPANLLFSAKEQKTGNPINIETQSTRITELQTLVLARQASQVRPARDR
jgi:hypothetical protein